MDGSLTSLRFDDFGCVVVDEGPSSHVFMEPVEVLTAEKPEDVPGILARIDEATLAGKWVAGYISYDAGIGLDRPMRSRHRSDVPLIWLGVYERCEHASSTSAEPIGPQHADLGSAELSIDASAYREAVEKVKRYIEAGDIYQANFTAKLRFRHAGPASSLFARLRSANPVGHSALVNAGPFQVISLSPELFVKKVGREVLTRPMKGTAPRGRFCEEDDRATLQLANDAKNRAENLMIVDLMRNDLGRVCQTGTVRVPELFQVERYPSLLQMTSDVVGLLRPGTTHAELLRALFPPGSVTGAPKLRAMEIVDELESEARGVYCGCIGYFAPNGDCLLNVAIRTVVKRGGECELGVGGGIVADSEPESEYREALLKGAFLRSTPASFGLFETMRWDARDGFLWLDEHLSRLADSCVRFGVRFDREHLRRRLLKEAGMRPNAVACRVKATVWPAREIETDWQEFQPDRGRPWRVRIASTRVDSSSLKLYHKTTDRELHDRERRAALEAGFDEALFLNENGELTEGAITNLFVFDGETWLTPPIECGLLPGIWRGRRIASSRAVERRLTIENLRSAIGIVLGNSVRGEIQIAEIAHESGPVVWRRAELSQRIEEKLNQKAE